VRKLKVNDLKMLVLNKRTYGLIRRKSKWEAIYYSAGEAFILGDFVNKKDAVVACALNANKLWHEQSRLGET